MAPDNAPKPRKDEHTVRLTSAYTQIAESLAKDLDMAFAEVLTKACERGLDEMIERHTKQLVREKLKRRMQNMDAEDD